MEELEEMKVPARQMQEMLVQMAQMRIELDNLKSKTQALPHPTTTNLQKPGGSTTRRKLLRRLAGGLVAGLAVGGIGAGLPQNAEAKLIAGQGIGIGAIAVPPGATFTGHTPTSTVYGLYATSDMSTDVTPYSPNYKIGVVGLNTTDTEDGSAYYGVYGEAKNAGVYGQSFGDQSSGVFGVGKGTQSYGVRGDNDNHFGVYGTSDTSIGVRGTSDSGNGVSGSSNRANGVQGFTFDGHGVDGYSSKGYGVYGSTNTGSAGYFEGKVTVTGFLNKAGGGFKIDHPLDPANKFLYHSFVESPDMKNIYDGVVALDNQGEATVKMPDWFEALNSDFRYQLTSIGHSMPDLYIAEELKERKFKIAGGLAGQRVSWMITGIRQDVWAKSLNFQVEETKTGEDKGKYLHPELFGQPKEMRVGPNPSERK